MEWADIIAEGLLRGLVQALERKYGPKWWVAVPSPPPPLVLPASGQAVLPAPSAVAEARGGQTTPPSEPSPGSDFEKLPGEVLRPAPDASPTASEQMAHERLSRVRRAREMRAAGSSYRKIAAALGVSVGTAHNYLNGP